MRGAQGLLWIVGGYCAVIGVLIAVVPHRFDLLEATRVGSAAWSVLLLGAGASLLAIAVLRLSRWVGVLATLVAAAVLAGLAVSLGVAGETLGALCYGSLALVLAGALLSDVSSLGQHKPRVDLFTLAMAVAALGIGAGLLVGGGPVEGPVAPGGIAAWFLVGGVALLAVQGLSVGAAGARLLAHGLAGSAFLVYFALLASPSSWLPGLVLYGGWGLLLLLQPVLAPLLRRPDHASLSWRLALALAAATVLPLTVGAVLVATHEERAALREVIARQSRLAAAQVDDLVEYLGQRQQVLLALAQAVATESIGATGQRALLEALAPAFPDVHALVRYDASGGVVAASRDPPGPTVPTTLFTDGATGSGTRVALVADANTDARYVVLLAPVRRPSGEETGFLGVVIPPATVEASLGRDSQAADVALYLLDADGQLLGQHGVLSNSACPGADPARHAARRGTSLQGAFVENAPGGSCLIGYATVPDLGWTILAEQPLETALAGERAARDLALVALLGVGLAAAAAGVMVAAALAAPLRSLALAVDRLPAEGCGPPLPRSTVREIARLAEAFEALRARLAERTEEQHRAAAQVRRQLDFTTAIAHSLAEGVCAADRAGRITFANPAAATLLGWSAGALVGEELDRALHGPEHTAPCEACVLRQVVAAPDAPRQGEDVFQRADGQRFPVRFAAAPIRTGAEVTGVVLAFSDITARKRFETDLQASEQRLQLALAAGRMGTWEWDIAADAVRWSPLVEVLHGLAPGAFTGTLEAFLACVHPDDRPRLEQAITDILREGATYHVEYRIVQPTGRVAWLEARGQLIREADGRPVRLVGVVVDITERKRTEETLGLLAESSVLLSASLDYETTLVRVARLAVPDLADVCIVDLLEADGHIRRVAVAHTDPAHEQVASALQRFWAPRPDGPNSVARTLRTGQPELATEVDDARLQAIAQSPEHLAVLRALGPRSAMNVPLIARGRTLGALTFLSTTSGRRFGPSELALAEDIARRAALAVDNARLYREAREAVRLRDEFLALAAHELKTPITSLRGFAQLKRRQIERAGPLPPSELSRALQVIDQQADRLARLVDRLLDISRLDAGQFQLDLRPVDLVPLVQHVVAAAQATTQQHALAFHGPPHLRAVVDPARIEQVVANLLDNAIQFSPGGGTVEVDLRAQGAEVCLQITDPGIGILPGDRERVFERFYRRRAAGYVGGLGLSLHLARQIVELHGGTIAIEAPPEGGTRVVVRLPVAQRESLPIAAEERPAR